MSKSLRLYKKLCPVGSGSRVYIWPSMLMEMSLEQIKTFGRGVHTHIPPCNLQEMSVCDIRWCLHFRTRGHSSWKVLWRNWCWGTVAAWETYKWSCWLLIQPVPQAKNREVANCGYLDSLYCWVQTSLPKAAKEKMNIVKNPNIPGHPEKKIAGQGASNCFPVISWYQCVQLSVMLPWSLAIYICQVLSVVEPCS